MPTNITIRNIPDEVYAKIKKKADLHHRSINSEVIVYLKKLVQSNRRDPDQIITRAKKLKQKAKGTLSIEEIQQAIDQGRP
ncbi:MAG: Arc family DNA-binding protein [Balneolaceae bacterium]